MPSARRKPLIGAAIAALLVVPAAAARATPPSADSGGSDTMKVEYFPDPQGSGRVAEVPVTSPALRSAPRQNLPAADGTVYRISKTGPTESRLDVTIVGDGYTADEQDDFVADAQAKWQEITSIEPYRSYRGLFNVWAVVAVSQDHGVSGDPTSDVVKDTALGAYFWCRDIERLLCVDVAKTATYAAKAPASDQVIVIANSKKYGGAGYSRVSDAYEFDGIATVASDNAQSSIVGSHEMAHSVGHVGDEYTYASYGEYQGAEPTTPNTTIYTSAQLQQRQTKWYRWLGAADPSGGTVGTFEGSGYYPLGLYRPTQNSIMRSLANVHFNLPSREALINGFYRYADAVTASTPTTVSARSKDQVSINPAPLGEGLSRVQLRWYVDGHEVKTARGRTSVAPQRLQGLAGSGQHELTVKAVDQTSAVRDPAVRKATSNEITWQVVR